MSVSTRLKKRREEVLFSKLGRAQFRYMQMLEAPIIADVQQRERMIIQLGKITALYMEIREGMAKELADA